jgi:hypothetical protein
MKSPICAYEVCYTGHMNYDDIALQLHKQHKGKITTALRDAEQIDKAKLSAYYTPGDLILLF